MTRITWWEQLELEEHLRSRDDIWTQSDDNPFLWLRTVNTWNGDGEPEEVSACALLLTPPSDTTSPWRMYSVTPHPIGWTAEETDEYVSRLLRHWTAYGFRVRLEKFLSSSLELDARTAEAAAIAIAGLDNEDTSTGRVDSADPEHTPPASQEELFADGLPPQLAGTKDPLDIGTFFLARSLGWVKLRLQGNQIRVLLNIRDSLSGGFSCPLEGFVRPPNGAIRDTAALLAGWTPSEATRTVSEAEKQRLLEGIVNSEGGS